MKKMILVRHGQTEWNIEQRYQGQQDTELTDFGREQMKMASRQLDGETIDQIMTSPLKRAKESAEIVARACSLEVQVDFRLAEMDLGSWEGKPYATGRNVENWFELAPHGGETGARFHRRVQNWFVAQPPTEKTLLLVVHGLVVQSLLSYLLEEPFDRWHKRPVRNGALAVITRKDWGWRLEKFNQEVAS